MAELPATLAALRDALVRHHLSPREAVAAQVLRLTQLDKTYHCVARLTPRADDPVVPGGLLTGVGLAHKDIFDTAGRHPGRGRSDGAAAPAVAAATVISRLTAQGACHLASLVMAPDACGATGDNDYYGRRCVNPLRASAVVGGSSSGSAVAVAGEMAYASLGTDTAGSIRIPAATCGLLGLKTTHGLVPLDGVHPLAPSLDGVGLLARSADDAMLVLDAIADPGVLRQPTTSPVVIKAWLPEADLDPQVATVIDQFVRDWRIDSRTTRWSDHQPLTSLAEIVLAQQAAHTHRSELLTRQAPPAVKAVALAGLALPPEWYAAAVQMRARHSRAFVEQHLRDHQLLLLPALPNPIPDWRQVSGDGADFDVHQLLALHRYMGFVNYLGLPAMVIPIGRDSQDMPISVQLIARPFHERQLLRFAQAVQARDFGTDGFTPAFTSKVATP